MFLNYSFTFVKQISFVSVNPLFVFEHWLLRREVSASNYRFWSLFVGTPLTIKDKSTQMLISHISTLQSIQPYSIPHQFNCVSNQSDHQNHPDCASSHQNINPKSTLKINKIKPSRISLSVSHVVAPLSLTHQKGCCPL